MDKSQNRSTKPISGTPNPKNYGRERTPEEIKAFKERSAKLSNLLLNTLNENAVSGKAQLSDVQRMRFHRGNHAALSG